MFPLPPALFVLFLFWSMYRRTGSWSWEQKPKPIPLPKVEPPPAAPPARPGTRKRRPLAIGFSVAVSGAEKFFSGTDSRDVLETVKKKTGIMPGVGKPGIKVLDVSGGFNVVVKWSDSSAEITPAAAKAKIESIDPKLKGRIQNVIVKRG